MNYKTFKNKFEIKGPIAYGTALKKDGSELVFQIGAFGLVFKTTV